MPRPKPLPLASARPPTSEYHILTPRTPHSRAGREGEDIELEQIGLDDDERSDPGGLRVPLLQSENHPIVYEFNPDYDWDATQNSQGKWSRRLVTHIPLWGGILLSLFLLLLVLISLQKPEVLLGVIGQNGTATAPNASHNQTEAFISYANYTRFPLLPEEYRNECRKIPMAHSTYWGEMKGMAADVPHAEAEGVCSGSVTYMLDGRVGLTADLGILAQAAALARQRNRTFFVDDTYWNRGRWQDYFEDVQIGQPGPEPGCRPPPPEELVACPRTARHWLMNSRTAKWHLGHAFHEEFEDPYGVRLNRLKPIYTNAVGSFDATIRPNSEIASLIRTARSELATVFDNTSYIGVHIRRGDRSGTSWKYHNLYLPLPPYIEGAESAWARLAPEPAPPRMPVYVASDSPAAPSDYAGATEDAARVFSLSSSAREELREIASPREYDQKAFDTLLLEERVWATKGMVVDLALVSGLWAEDGDFKPEATVCGLSSSVCRLSAVAYGWQGAFGLEEGDRPDGTMDQEKKRWVEIDNAGSIIPEWEGFEMF